ncbi:MAG: ABC transporter permease [Pirellulaceae bacterium]
MKGALGVFPTRLAGATRLGIRSLAANSFRSLLTALGVVLGVASVIVMLAVGEAARFEALEQLRDLGASTIILRSTKPTDDVAQQQGVDMLAYGLTYADLGRIRATVSTVVSAAPMREYRKTVRYEDRKLEARIVSITPGFLAQNHITLALGRDISQLDEERYENVAIVGAETAQTLFPSQNPLGRSITIETWDRPRAFVVVGITEPKTLAAGEGAGDVDYSRVVFIPFATDRVRFGRDVITMRAGSYQAERIDISQVTIAVDNIGNVARTAAAIRSLIDQFHPRQDVAITVPLDLLVKAEESQRMFTMILGAIAGISLLVGGIGIMNIMLATVTERTREIGIRRALGANRRDIATQFLVECLILTSGGGIVGIALGIGLSIGVAWALELPTIIPLWSPLVAFGVSAVVGLVSGIVPARRAALLDPIEALRHD